jgi:hypothetical protein
MKLRVKLLVGLIFVQMVVPVMGEECVDGAVDLLKPNPTRELSQIESFESSHFEIGSEQWTAAVAAMMEGLKGPAGKLKVTTAELLNSKQLYKADVLGPNKEPQGLSPNERKLFVFNALERARAANLDAAKEERLLKSAAALLEGKDETCYQRWLQTSEEVGLVDKVVEPASVPEANEDDEE